MFGLEAMRGVCPLEAKTVAITSADEDDAICAPNIEA